ncbi:MAG: DNA primase DnaG, partial [Patescibacteria group bacterium]
MGKTYIDTVKYLVYANVDIGGLVEKPDVVGAVFGQTEGLLGDELDLRELQKNGRIGRIEVDLQPRSGRSIGKIKLPSSLDMVETSILAAALETVDRVGPCDASITVEKIEDTRNAKRKMLVDRAKTLLKTLLMNEIPESREISEMVRQEVKIAEISEYGPEKLPSGPGVERMDSIIIVEGRADVLNLLKNDINNVVAVGGANVPVTIAKLCKEKEVTVFLDGDRGGDIILNELSQVADIDFVARAPTGKEVEELSRKELIKCLRSKISYEQAMEDKRERSGRRESRFGNRGDDRRDDR